jgi:hypothetical protein
MAYEVKIAETAFESNGGIKVRIAHPSFVPVMTNDLLRALDWAIVMLKQGCATDVGRAFDYALAKVCFSDLRDGDPADIVKFVDQPNALYTLGFGQFKNVAENCFPVHGGVFEYFRSRDQIHNWLKNQLKLPIVARAPNPSWIVPTMATWLKVVWLIWSAEVARDGEEYSTTYAILNEGDEVQRDKYVRACSLAWLEHIRDKQPNPTPGFAHAPLGTPGSLPF